MELSPKAITGVQFRTARKGYEPEEVRAFLAQLARGVETVQAQAAASDARARSAMAKLQEMASREEPDPGESMKRTLLLAQRTADAAVAEAHEQAKSIVGNAEERSRAMVGEAQAKADQLVTDAESAARRASSVEKARIEAEIAALTSRRDQLHAEAARLEGQIATQRERIGSAVRQLAAVLEHPDGLQPSPLPPPSPDPREHEAVDPAEPAAAMAQPEAAPVATEPAPRWSDEDNPGKGSAAAATRSALPTDGEDDVAGALARLGDAPPRAAADKDADGPPTAEVPVIASDDELVRNFFDPEPFTDDRWKGRRTD